MERGRKDSESGEEKRRKSEGERWRETDIIQRRERKRERHAKANKESEGEISFSKSKF